MTDIVGYNEDPYKNPEGEYEWDNMFVRTYIFRPIRENERGMISTAAVLMCGQCGHWIKSMGGPGYRSRCLKCYEATKVLDFAEGHEHTILEK
jgi:hypothetical protein